MHSSEATGIYVDPIFVTNNCVNTKNLLMKFNRSMTGLKHKILYKEIVVNL